MSRILVVAVLAAATLCAAAAPRNVLQARGTTTFQLPDNIRIDGPFPSESPDDCADQCMAVEGCRGYQFRANNCSLTIQIPKEDVIDPEPTPEVSPSPDEVSPSPDEVSPSPDEVSPSPDEVSPSPDEVSPSPDEVSPSPDEVSPSPETPGEPTTIDPTLPDTPADDVLTDPDEITKFLQGCQNAGSLSATAAAIAACTVVLNNCPVPPEPEDAPFEQPVALSIPVIPEEARELLKQSLEAACAKAAAETCKNEAVNQAEVLNPECHRVLELGPATDVVIEDCADTVAANLIFSEEVGAVCEATSTEDTEDDLDDDGSG